MTAQQVIDRTGYDASLVRSIRRQLDLDQLRDVASHGADAGWPGFTHYNDTVAFFKKHRAAIVEMAERMADDLGEETAAMIAGFNCLEDDAETRKGIYACLGGGPIKGFDAELVANALAWFALEEVASAFADE